MNVPAQVNNRLQANPGKYLIISSSATLGGTKESIKDILQSNRVIWFQAGGNTQIIGETYYNISVTEASATGNPEEFRSGI